MKLKINGQMTPELQFREGRYFYTFTPQTDMDSVSISSDCLGDTDLNKIQIEKGLEMTPFEIPKVFQEPLSGIFKDLKEINLELSNPESELWGNIRINAKGMLEEYHDGTLQAEFMRHAGGVETRLRDELTKTEAQFSQTVNGLRSDVQDATGKMTTAIQTAEGYYSRAVDDVKGQFNEIKRIADGTSSRVGTVESNLGSRIDQLSTQIRSAVTGTNFSSYISQNANSIWMAVRDNVNNTANGAKMTGDEIKSAINLSVNGVTIQGKQVAITGDTYIQNGVIKSAHIGSLDAGKITTGTLDAARIAVNSIDGSKMVFDQAFVNKMTANEAYLKQIFAKNAFITQVQAVTLSASKISGGILSATNGAMKVNLNNGQILYYTNQAAMKRILSGYPTQFIKFDTGTYGGKPGGVTVIGSNRDGSENPNNGSFAGIRIWNGIQSDGSFFDKMDIGADDVQIGHKVFDDGNGTYRGWQFKSYGEGSAVSLFPYGNYGRATITATNYRIFNLANNTYVNLEEVLNKIFDNFNNLNNNGNYQRSFYSSWR